MPTPDPADTSPSPARARHVVDRAVEYAALVDRGWSLAVIARRRRRSKGHVSILARLGRALAGLADDELASFRHPRITWRLAQRVVRRGTTDAAVRQQLRHALGGFSSHNVDRRTLRTHRPTPRATAGHPASPALPRRFAPPVADAPDSAPVEPAAGAERAGAAPRAGTPDARHASAVSPLAHAGWLPDPVAAWHDPAAYLARYRAHLATLHAAVGAELRTAIAARALPTAPPLAGQSLRALAQSAAARRHPGGAVRLADRAVLDDLRSLDATLLLLSDRG